MSLGGDKWTIRLMHEYAPDIQKSTGVDVIALATLQNKKQHYKLLEHFHKAKEQLTSEEEVCGYGCCRGVSYYCVVYLSCR